MDAVTPLIGIIVLCLALTANFFRTAWKLGILRSFGRRHPLNWRAWIAGALAACLPMSGAMAAMVIIPESGADDLVHISAAELALQLAVAGFVFHWLNDRVLHWGKKDSSRS